MDIAHREPDGEQEPNIRSTAIGLGQRWPHTKACASSRRTAACDVARARFGLWGGCRLLRGLPGRSAFTARPGHGRGWNVVGPDCPRCCRQWTNRTPAADASPQRDPHPRSGEKRRFLFFFFFFSFLFFFFVSRCGVNQRHRDIKAHVPAAPCRGRELNTCAPEALPAGGPGTPPAPPQPARARSHGSQKLQPARVENEFRGRGRRRTRCRFSPSSAAAVGRRGAPILIWGRCGTTGRFHPRGPTSRRCSATAQTGALFTAATALEEWGPCNRRARGGPDGRGADPAARAALAGGQAFRDALHQPDRPTWRAARPDIVA